MARKVVLIAEDDARALALLVEALGDEFTIYGVADGRDALALFDTVGDIGLAILDNNLPTVTGLDILAELRRRRSAVPAILMSALMSEALADAARACGATAVVHKPLDLRSFRDRVRALLGAAADDPAAVWPDYRARAAGRCLPPAGDGSGY